MGQIHVNKILEILERTYADVRSGLRFGNPFELLIATVLSAQCTDARVNKATKELFKSYPTPQDIANSCAEDLIPYIKTCGLYRHKSKYIHALCIMLVNQYHGQVPNTREALESLPGVGRKTANVVLSNAFHVPAIAVDTHVFRVTNRIGLAHAKTVNMTEIQLMQCIPIEKWSIAHHLLIFHGRNVCMARKPHCSACVLNAYCSYAKALATKPSFKV